MRILFYHRVSDEHDELAVSPARFRAQMHYLAAAGFDVVGAVQAAELVRDSAFRENLIGLSFDDGYRDVAEHALPVLEELGFGATVFIAPAVTDGEATFHWYEQQPELLSWDQIRACELGGTLRFEPHSLTHPVLTGLDEEGARREIGLSKEVLEARLGRPVTAFCYPAGIFTDRERRLVVEAGYKYAFTCEPGANDSAGDPFALFRIQVGPADRMVDFRAKVAGAHDTSPLARSIYRAWRHNSPGARLSFSPKTRLVSPRTQSRNGEPRGRSLIVSSFVLPHVGGVEHFVVLAREALRRSEWEVRVLACRPKEEEADADVTVPTWYVAHSGWPLPVGGWRRLWGEIGRADLLLVNGHRNLLPVVSALLGRLRRKRVVFVIHAGSGSVQRGSISFRAFARLFDLVLARPALRVSEVACVAQAGVEFMRDRFGVSASYLPFPLRELPSAPHVELAPDEPLRVVWAGRLYPEKNAVAAVTAIEKVREERDAVLHFYGDGILRSELEAAAATRPWVVLHGMRSWDEVQEAQGTAHVCLTTSTLEAVGLTTLEPLARGIPAVSTAVGDAPRYYLDASLKGFCVPARDPDSMAKAVLELAARYSDYRGRFVENGHLLAEFHRGGKHSLVGLVDPDLAQTAGAPPLTPVR